MKFLKGLLVPLIIVAIWYICSSLKILNSYIIPPPIKIIKTTSILIKNGDLLRNILVSFYRVFLGFLLAFIIAFPTSIILGMNRRIEVYFEPLLEFIRHIPPIAAIPILILWLGIGEASKIAVIILATFFPIFMNTLSGVRNCDKKLLEVGDIFNFSPFKKFKKIILPSIIPYVIVGIRLGLGYSWRSLIGAELIAASSGIGYMIIDAEQLSRPDIIIVGIISVGIVGFLIDYILYIVTKKFIPWHKGDLDNGWS